MNTLSEIDAAYLAGIIDGEGSVMLSPSVGKFRCPTVAVASNDLELLEWITDAVGAGRTVKKTKRVAHHRDSFMWEIKGPRAVALLAVVSPFQRIARKRARAELIVRDYARLTRRNGNYSESERAAKLAFESAFFAI